MRVPAALRPLISRATYQGWGWLILGGAVVMPYIMAGEVVAVASGRGGVDAAVTVFAPQTFLWVLPFVLLTGLVLPIRPVLLLTARNLLRAEIEPAGRTGQDWRTRWRTAGWYTIQLAVGGLLSGVTLALLPMLAILMVMPVLPERALGPAGAIAPEWSAWWGPAVAVVALIALIYLVAGMTAGLRRLAPVLLGPSATERLLVLRQQAAQLAARNQLARELHDSVGHALSVVMWQSAAANRLLAQDPAAVRRALAAVEETARRALADLDHALGVLRDDPAPDPAVSQPWEQPSPPGLAQLPALFADCGLPVEADLLVEAAELPAEPSREAYRIIQESLTNALRHGERSTVTVRVAREDDELVVAVTNPVAAGQPELAGGGRGITGMRERVLTLGGSLQAGPDGPWWRVTARLPVRQEGAA
ncbi:two-component sensor histidine kinase [Natronosporangium hydrolyticum]|uniref:histidine kinase n=1 Tax=Natronosporangium hydrolyticum TaxID=2811111 RepID=A0A895YFX6_9ACTN|nr:histidine kinase [Natronosporangium hydrolyticum]QSB13446.1 two-component sensor histidine kinase [Natronosporangium hydrolyticum]